MKFYVFECKHCRQQVRVLAKPEAVMDTVLGQATESHNNQKPTHKVYQEDFTLIWFGWK